ncbi:MAG TPA: MmcQ/YjbR family DNA-binding protein [Candidatus Binataceae bacterium]|nr:MmcQ/YjbR family DNA-binding protein [Candidatus Binataceae bacterium]
MAAKKPARDRHTSSVVTLREIALSFPGVAEGVSYGTLAFRVRKKLICRMKEDGESLAIRMEFGEREILMEGEPRIFYITEHYRNYPMVLAHLSRLHPDELRRIFANAWRRFAGARLVEQLPQ